MLTAVDSQLLWRNNVAASPTTWAVLGNGGHNVFKNDNTLVSDANGIDPTYMLSIDNPNGEYDVCFLEFTGKMIAGADATAASTCRAEIYGIPHRGVSAVDDLTTFSEHPLKLNGGTLTNPVHGDALGFHVWSGGTPPSFAMAGMSTEWSKWPLINGTVAANMWFHFLFPIGFFGTYHISGMRKIYAHLKSVNGSDVTGTPSFIGAWWAHLYKEIMPSR